MSRRRSSAWHQIGGELGIFQRQPLAARAFEVDLHAAFVAAAFAVRHHALAEFLVEHALTDAPYRARVRAALSPWGGGERFDVAVGFVTAG